MTRNDKDTIDRLRMELNRLDRDIELAQKELDRLLGRKKKIMEEMSMHSDEKYEEDVLTLVYEQRKKQK